MDLNSADLLTAATLARAQAYAPYSRFAVGAALRDAEGRVHVGANVENAAYPSGLCAEAVAIGAMVAAGGRVIVEMLVVADAAAMITPCGACRQRIREFAGPDLPIHLANLREVSQTLSLAALLPHSFGPENLT